MVRVFNHWLSPRKAAFFFAEETVLVVALLAGASLAPVAAQGRYAPPVAPSFLRALIASLFFAGALYLGDLYDVGAAVRDRTEGRRLLRAIGVAVVAQAVADVLLQLFLPGWMLHRGLVLSASGGALGVILARALMPAVVGPPTRVLFLGAGLRARELARAIDQDAAGLYQSVGFVPVAAPKTPPSVLEDSLHEGQLGTVAQRLKAHVIVVAMEDRRAGFPVEELLYERTTGRRVVDDVGFAEAALQRIPLSLVRPSALIFDEGFRVSRTTRFTKRFLDVVLSLALLVLASPVMLFSALFIALSDGRPVLFFQERTGRGGRVYRMTKFRTMRRDAERLGAAWATEDDPRVLRGGRFLRRTRLDELPQLLNVLAGDMSLVGPRPERPVFLSELKARWPLFAMRELVKPGLTGWAQLKFGYGSTLEEQAKKLEYDLYYIKNAGLFLDLVCLAATAKVVLLGKGSSMRLEEQLESPLEIFPDQNPMRIVALGGGTGLPRVLAGLGGGRAEPDGGRPLHLTAVVTVADDGGSSGELRRHYGMPAPGDVRNCLAAMAAGPSLLASVFQHRFEGEGGLAGHTVGNVLLTALAQRLGGFEKAVDAAALLLGVKGVVLPATLGPTAIVGELVDGTEVEGESALAESGGTVARVRLGGIAVAPAAVPEAIAAAELVVLGPGSLFTSVLASALGSGVKEALAETGATRVLVVNLFEEEGETRNRSAADHVRLVKAHLGDVLDVALVHRGPLPPLSVGAHERAGCHPVQADREAIEALGVVPFSADIAGPFGRHDPTKLARALLKIARAR